jgi:hypothetical protein
LISLLLQPFLSIKKKRRRGESERGKVLFLSWMELKLSEERWENGEIQKSTVEGLMRPTGFERKGFPRALDNELFSQYYMDY